MEEFIQKKGNVLVVRVPAELDHFSADQIRDASDEILQEQNIREIAFDFRRTTFMDSSGIGLIMGRYRQMQLLGGRVRAVHVNERVQKILTISGVSRVIEIEPEKSWI